VSYETLDNNGSTDNAKYSIKDNCLELRIAVLKRVFEHLHIVASESDIRTAVSAHDDFEVIRKLEINSSWIRRLYSRVFKE
jgi:hypothetical protein